MPRPTRSWHEKLHDSRHLPKVIQITGRMASRWGAGTCVIPAPLEVDALMRQIPKGKLITIDNLRHALAKRHAATIACPITTGIFAWIAAHAAAESRDQGRKKITPYWRTLKSNGELNPKYPGGLPALVSLLRSEGHSIISKGKRRIVRDYEKSLVPLLPAKC